MKTRKRKKFARSPAHTQVHLHSSLVHMVPLSLSLSLYLLARAPDSIEREHIIHTKISEMVICNSLCKDSPLNSRERERDSTSFAVVWHYNNKNVKNRYYIRSCGSLGEAGAKRVNESAI